MFTCMLHVLSKTAWPVLRKKEILAPSIRHTVSTIYLLPVLNWLGNISVCWHQNGWETTSGHNRKLSKEEKKELPYSSHALKKHSYPVSVLDTQALEFILIFTADSETDKIVELFLQSKVEQLSCLILIGLKFHFRAASVTCCLGIFFLNP